MSKTIKKKGTSKNPGKIMEINNIKDKDESMTYFNFFKINSKEIWF